MPMTFLTGGVRSGKSSLAVRLAARASREPSRGVTFIATAVAMDDELTERIARHRRDRPASWVVIEEPLALATAVESVPPDDVAVVDCLTLWVSNLMFHGLEAEIGERTTAAIGAVAGRAGPTIVVSNEVGSGVHAESALGRRYAEILGRVNATFAQAAAESYLVVAGKGLRLEDLEPDVAR